MKLARIGSLAVCVALLGLCGCDQRAATEPKSEQGVAKDNVFSGQAEALDKAKGVSQAAEDAAARRDAEIDKQSEGK